MKKCLLLLLLTGLFSFTITAQKNEAEFDNLNSDSKAFITQLKEQLKSQLKEQMQTQLTTGFDSL